jgi:hypothetical protein
MTRNTILRVGIAAAALAANSGSGTGTGSTKPVDKVGGVKAGETPTPEQRAAADTGENLAAQDTTQAAASPTEGSPTAAEAEAAARDANEGEHGAAGVAQPIGTTSDDGGLIDGLRIANAFQDVTTGERVAPGQPIPPHILEDGDRMEKLMAAGFITDEPIKPAPATAVPGGTLSVSHSRDGHARDFDVAQPMGERR